MEFILKELDDCKSHRARESMEKLKLYEVTKGSTDKSVLQGDIIWISNNGDLNFYQAHGFYRADEWVHNSKVNDFTVKECNTHVLEVGDGYERVKLK